MLASDLLFIVTSRMGCGSVIIDELGKIESYNEVAEKMILSTSESIVGCTNDIRSLLKNILNNDSNRFRLNSESWFVIPREGMRPLTLHAVPAGGETDPYGKTLIVITDLDENRSPSVEALQKLFNLTYSEASIAILISHGATPNEIANERGITLWTVRSQLASVYSKTQTRRQAELVALMLKVAILS